MASDIELKKAADESLDKFNKLYDPNGKNPQATNVAYRLYKSTSLADIQAKGVSGSSSVSSGSSGSGGFLDKINPVKKVTDVVATAISTQEQTGYMPGLKDEMITASGMATKLGDILSNIKNPLKMLASVGSIVGDQTELYLRQQTELLGIINKQAGLTGKFSEDVREELTMANVPLVRLGIGFEELASGAQNLVSESGRFITLNRDSWYDAGQAAKAYVGTLSELVSMYPSFEKIGIGASDVAKQIELTGSRSINLGLQSSKTTKELSTNLSRLNEFGFKNGVQGLAEMVRKSTELRMNMDSVFKIADDVMDPEKAISLSANLQVLGGAIGAFNDPLKMMYDATNNVEGLQDALIGAAGSLATYNSEQGRFEITGVNLRRAKAMAAELGISYTELANGAIAAAERTSAATALMGRGLKLDDDQQRFLTNISQMKGGQMTIELNSDRLQKILGVDSDVREIALEKLTQKQVDSILEYQNEFKKLSPEEIIQKQATDIEQIGLNVSFLAAAARVRAAQAGGGMIDQIKKLVGYDPGDFRRGMNKVTKEGAELLNFPMKTKGKVEPLESVKIDQTTKKIEEPKKLETTPITEQTLTNAMMNVHNATKNEKNGTIVISNELQPLEPNDYRYVKIK
jgi:hypothetical protein